jgi:hypothetical protein
MAAGIKDKKRAERGLAVVQASDASDREKMIRRIPKMATRTDRPAYSIVLAAVVPGHS